MCSKPILTLQEIFNQSNPKEIYRSKVFSLSPIIYFACNAPYSSRHTWSLSKIDWSSLSWQAISMSVYPTASSVELVIQANTLAYGLYRFKFQVDITEKSNLLLSNNIETFIQIIPTGLNVFAIRNGIKNQLIGYNQEFTLSPAEYSKDLDDLILPSSLSFKFYCRTLNLNNNFKSSQINLIDLMTTLKTVPSLPMNRTTTCFSSTSNFLNQ